MLNGFVLFCFLRRIDGLSIGLMHLPRRLPELDFPITTGNNAKSNKIQNPKSNLTCKAQI